VLGLYKGVQVLTYKGARTTKAITRQLLFLKHIPSLLKEHPLFLKEHPLGLLYNAARTIFYILYFTGYKRYGYGCSQKKKSYSALKDKKEKDTYWLTSLEASKSDKTAFISIRHT